MKTPLVFSSLIITLSLFAQAPTALQQPSTPFGSPAASPSGNSGGTAPRAGDESEGDKIAGGGNNFLGKDLPFLDPNGNFSFDGQHGNVMNNRLFRARFEKYLNAEEESGPDSREYNAVIKEILDRLAPGQADVFVRDTGKTNLETAFSLLSKASSFDIDAHLCDAIASDVYSIWQSQNENDRLERLNVTLEQKQQMTKWNLQHTIQDLGNDIGSATKKSQDPFKEKLKQEQLDASTTDLKKDMLEKEVEMKANIAKEALNDTTAKLNFQTLMLQLFLQRRYQHVIICTRFYRAIFKDGSDQLTPGKDVAELFGKVSGGPPTLEVLDSLSSEAMRDVKEGVEAFLFLLDKNEMESATNRLAEAFAIGEYMPEIRLLPREKKRQALAFFQKANQLMSAMEVRDYGLAEQLIKEIQPMAQDFDATKPNQVIQTAKQVSALHLGKAINAASAGDQATMESEIKAASEIWPRNPQLAEVTKKIFDNSNVINKSLNEFDQLLQEKNYWLIDQDKGRFLIATANSPEREKQLEKVLTDVATIRMTILQAEAIAKRGDKCGAWETVESIYKKFPDDNKLNQLRATLTTEASDFVNSLSHAKELEDSNQPGSSLAWYLRAQHIYPSSDFAQQGITRLVTQLFPENK